MSALSLDVCHLKINRLKQLFAFAHLLIASEGVLHMLNLI